MVNLRAVKKKPSAFITTRHIKDSANFVTDKNVAKCSHCTLASFKLRSSKLWLLQRVGDANQQ